jgi:hypothetical protein
MANNSTRFVRWSAEKYNAVGHCIYCGSTENLSDEHIVPLGLQPKGGDWFLPQASCGECADVTKRFEGLCLQGTLGPLRAKLNLRSRRKLKTTVELTTNHRDDGCVETRVVPLDEFPMVCLGFDLEPAGLLRHIQPAKEFVGRNVVRYQKGELEKHLQEGVALKLGVGPLDYARMLAKIAHSYAIARFGEASFVPFLPEIILGKSDYAPHFVGGDRSGVPLIDEPNVLHRVYGQACDLNGQPYLLVAVRLFAFMGMPRYLVVVGKIADGSLERLRRIPL